MVVYEEVLLEAPTLFIASVHFLLSTRWRYCHLWRKKYAFRIYLFDILTILLVMVYSYQIFINIPFLLHLYIFHFWSISGFMKNKIRLYEQHQNHSHLDKKWQIERQISIICRNKNLKLVHLTQNIVKCSKSVAQIALT